MRTRTSKLPRRMRRGISTVTPLRCLIGRCWSAHTLSSLSGFVPVPDHRILLIRSTRHRRRGSGKNCSNRACAVVSTGAPRDELETGITAWASDIDRIHIHINAYVVDDSYGRANDWASSGGMSPDDVRRIIRVLGIRSSPRLCRPCLVEIPAPIRSGALHEPMRDIAITLAEELRGSAARTASSG